MLPKEAMVSSRPPPMYGDRLAAAKAKASPSVVLTLLVVLVPLIGPATSQGAFPGANGKIAFQSSRDFGYEIYTMNADGSSPTRLTNNAVEDARPAWSPDGTKIAFRSSLDGNQEIYMINADGSGQTRLTNNTSMDTDPTWSPDGTKIAFATDRDRSNFTYEVYTMNADGSNQIRLTGDSLNDQSPAWSPDGTEIAFATNFAGFYSEIYTINPDGTGETLITNQGDADPAWSPDGTKIAFASCRDDLCHETGATEIYAMNADGSNQTRLTNSPGDDFEPAWSPDGTKIAFWTRRDGNSEIYTMNPDGTNQTRITNNTDLDRSPDWQPVAVPGSYPRPKSASPLRVSLVPAYKQCTAPNRTHGPPLAFASCNPPTPASSELTVGTPDANGQAANSAGHAKYGVILGVPGGIDDADVRVTFQLTDVRRQGTLADYTGELRAAGVVRITDQLGGPANEAASVTDFEHELTVPCAATGGEPGATCLATTTLDAVVPGTIREGKRAIWQLGQVRVSDGGPDGLASTTPNTPFAVQGVFVP